MREPRSSCARCRAVILVAICSLSPPTVAQEPTDPGSVGPTVTTGEDVTRRRVALFQAAMLQDLRTRAEASGQGDAVVEALVTTYAEYLARWLFQESAWQKRLLSLGRRALSSGSEDPLVLLATGDGAYLRSRFDEALPMLTRAADELAEGSRSPLVKHLAWSRLTSLMERRGTALELERTRDRAEQYLVAAVADPVFAGEGLGTYLRVVEDFYARTGVPPQFAARIAEVENAHRYPVLFLRAEREFDLGWQARGTETTDRVTAEGWREFHAHLESAADLAEEAFAIAPQFPNAPALMIRIAGAASAPRRVLREWFDRTVAAQFDYTPAYESYAWFSMPRWGGSHDLMMRFANECLAGGRFDTRVPDMYRVVLATLMRDSDDPADAVSSQQVRDAIVAVHDGYAARIQRAPLRRYDLSQHAILLALSGRARQAAALYQSIGGGFDDSALRRYGIERDWLEEELAPHLVPHVPEAVPPFDVFAGYSSTAPDGTPPARPIPVTPNATTTQQTNAALAAWLSGLFVEQYRAHGRHAETWDAKVTSVLDRMETVLRDRMEPIDAELLADVTALLEAGCDDPLFRFAASEVVARADGTRSFELLGRCLESVQAADYSPVIVFLALRSMESKLRSRNREADADALLARTLDSAIAMAADPCFADGHERRFVQLVIPQFDVGWDLGRLTESQLAKIPTHDGVPPWILHVLRGLHHCAIASRGPIDPWPTEDRRRYFQHVAEAERHLRAAHELRPDWPEAAAAMIVVRMLEPGEDTPRDWFDRAVAAEFDYEPAYRNYAWSLHPESGGSIREMYRFAVTCLETGRFETLAPLWYARTIEHLRGALDDPRWAWSSPEVGDRMAALVEGTVKAAPKRWMVEHMTGALVVTDWAGGRYARALEGWRAGDRRLDANWLAFLGIDEAKVRDDLRALDSRDR